jgi:hypothetical protein
MSSVRALVSSGIITIVLTVAGGCASDGAAGAGDGGPGDQSDGGPGGGDGGVVPLAGGKVFDPDVLHRVEITVAAGDLDTLDSDQTVRVRCTIAVDGETVVDAGCRKKGQTSQRPLSGKPGFTIKMNEFVGGQRLDGLRKLTLDNAVQDPSLLTGHLSYEVYRRAGLPAPRTAHATVSFNGVDKGLYVLEESTTADYLAAHFGDGSGNLYEGPWDFPKGAAAAELKDEVSEMRSRADLVAFADAVMKTPVANLEAALAVHLDVDRFLTNYAVEVVAALWDNYAYAAWNYYLYHVPGGRFVMLTHGVNWPYWHADLDPFDLYVYPWGDGSPPGLLCEKIRAVPALDARFRAEVKRVARDAWDVVALDARIDRAAAMFAARPLTGASADDRDTAVAQLGVARAFVHDRRAYLARLLSF